MISNPLACCCLSTLLFAAGCSTTGGQTGEESQEPCSETKVTLQAEEPSPLGFSAGEVLAAVGDSSEASLHWLPASDFSYGPESGSSTLSLVVVQAGAARFVESEARSLGGGMELMPLCQDRVEVDVTVSARTPGGAIAEEFETTLLASTASDIWLTRQFKPADLSGSFAVDLQSLGTTRFIRLTFEAHWSATVFRGLVAVGLEQSSNSGAEGSTSFRNVPVGCFSDSGSFDPTRDCTSPR